MNHLPIVSELKPGCFICWNNNKTVWVRSLCYVHLILLIQEFKVEATLGTMLTCAVIKSIFSALAGIWEIG